jgi:hypothetical protein
MATPAAPTVRHYQFVTPIIGAAHEAYVLIGAEDASIDLQFDTDYAIIIKVGNTGEMAANGDFQLQVQIDGGGFNNVDATSSNFRSAVSGDTDAATSTTERLSTSAETFINSVLDDVDGLTSTNVSAAQEFEFYFTFNVRSAELSRNRHDIEFRLTTGGVTFPHNLQLFASTPAPFMAYTPVPKANRVEAKRKLQTLLDEFPPKIPSISVVAETPALKANRTSFKRTLQTPLELNEYPPTPTKRTAGRLSRPFIIFPQRQPRSLTPIPIPYAVPAVPPSISNARSMLAVPFSTFKIRSRQFKQAVPVAEFAAPPAPVIPYPSWLPPLTNRVSFNRTLQRLPHPEATPKTQISVVAETPALKANRISFERTIQTLAHNPVYPATPPAFFEGFFPAPFRVKRIAITYHRVALRVLDPHVYPVTPPGFFEGQWPSHKPPPTLRVSFEREIQPVLNPHVYPPTPPGFFEGHWPAPVPPPTLRVSFTRKIQTLAIPPEYPPPPISAEDYAGLTPVLRANRISFTRKIQSVELDEHPPTPPAFFEGFFPAPFRVKRIAITYHRVALRVLDPHVYPATPLGFFEGQWPSHKPPPTLKSSFKREIQPVLNPHVYPATPPGFFDGFWPGSARVVTNRTNFKRTLQTPLELNEFPPPPVSAEDYAAFTPVAKFNWSYKRNLQSLGNPHVYPPTPAGFFDGFYPGSARVEANRTAFVQRLQSVPQLDERPATPPPTPPQPAVTANRVEFHRTRQALAHNPDYPATPAGFFDGFWPGSRRVEPLSSAFERRLEKLPQHDEWAQIPAVPALTALFRVKEANKVTFDRKRLSLPEHNEFPATPLSVIEYPAPWAAQSIRRNELRRQLQPVWKPASIVGEGFTPHAEDCKIWFADPVAIKWNAPCAGTIWRADPPCD